MTAATPAHVVSSHGLSARLPAGWSGGAASDDCDPVTRLRLVSTGGHVVVYVLEDYVNHPGGPLRRPARFRVPWRGLVRLAGCCETPSGAGWISWFRQRGRLIGFLVHRRGAPTAVERAQTDVLLDSLRVGPA